MNVFCKRICPVSLYLHLVFWPRTSEDHRLQPVVMLAWLILGGHHSLCPMAALWNYLDIFSGLPALFLFSLKGGKQQPAHRISVLLRQLIEEVDPGKFPLAHDIRGAAFSLTFLCTHSVSLVTEGGPLSPSRSVVTSHTWQGTHCVALGVLPTFQPHCVNWHCVNWQPLRPSSPVFFYFLNSLLQLLLNKVKVGYLLHVFSSLTPYLHPLGGRWCIIETSLTKILALTPSVKSLFLGRQVKLMNIMGLSQTLPFSSRLVSGYFISLNDMSSLPVSGVELLFSWTTFFANAA